MRGTTFVILCCTLQYATANMNIDLIDPENIDHTKGAHQTFLNASKRIVKTGDGYEEIETIQSRIDFDQAPKSLLLHHGKHPEKRKIVFVWGQDSRGNDVLYEEEETIIKLSDDELPIAMGSSSTCAIASSSSSGSGTGSAAAAAAAVGTGGYSEGEKSEYNGQSKPHGSVAGTSTVAVTAEAIATAQAKASGKKGKSENYRPDNQHGSAAITATAVALADVTRSNKGEQSDCYGSGGQHKSAAGTNAVGTATGYGKPRKSHYKRPAGRHGSAAGTSAAAAGRPGHYEYYGQDSVSASATGQTKSASYTEKRIREHGHGSLCSSSSAASVRNSETAHGHLASGLYDYNLHGSPATAATATAKVAAEVSVKGDKSDCELGAQHGSAADAIAVAVAAAAAATTARSGEGGNLGYNETPGQDVSAAGTAAAAAAGRAASGPIQYEQDGQDSVAALATGHTESASSTKIRILEHGHGSSRFSSSTASVTTSATESQKFSHGQGSVSDGTLASDDTARNANLYGNAGSFGFDEQFGSVKAKVAVAAAAGGSIEDRKSNHYGQHAADTSTAASPATAVATASGKGGQSYLYGTSGLHGSAASMTTVAASGPIQYEQDGQDSVAAPETGAYYRYADTYDEESLSSSEERFAHGHLASGLYDYNLHGSPATAATATAKVAAEVSVKGDKSDCYELGAQHGSAADASAVAVAAAAAATTARSGEGGNLGYNETPGQDVSAAGTAAAAAAGRAASGPIQYEQDGQDSVAALATGHTESASSTKIRILEHGHGSSRFSSSTASVTTSATESQKFSHGQGSVSDGTLASDDTARNANLYGNAGSFGFDEQFGSVKAKVAVAAAAGGSIEDRKSNHYGQHAADTSTAASPATAVATASGKGGQSYLYGTSGLHGSAASMTTVAASGPIQYEQDGQDSVAAPETGAYYRYADTYDEESLSSSEERFAHGHLASGLYDYNLHGSPATAATATAKVAAEVSVKGDKSDCYELGAQHGSAADASAVAVAAAAAATTARSGEGGNLGYNETPGQDVSAAGTAAAAAAGRAASGPIQYEQDGQDSVAALATGHTESASSTKIRILEHGHGSSRFSSSTASVTTSATESQKFSHGQGSVSDGTLASDDTARNANLYGNAGSFGFDEQFGSVKAKVAVAAAAGGSIEDRKSNHYGQHAADTSTAASPATAVATASGKGGQSYLYGTSGLHGSAASMTTVAASGPIQYEQDGQDSVAAPETGAYYRYADTYDEESLSSSEERFAHGHLASGLYDYNLHGSPATAATATAKVAAEVSVKGDKSDCYELGAQHGSAADASAVAVAAAAAATTARSGEGGNLGYNETPGQDVSAAGTAAAAAAGRAASGPIQYEQDGQDSVAALATGHTESASSTKIRILEHGHGSSRFSSSTASVTTSATESQKFSHGQGSVSDGTLASDDTARNANLYGNAGSFGFDEQFGSVKAKVAVAAAAGGSIEDRKSNHYGQHAADTSTAASPATAVATASGKGGQSYLYGTSGLHGSAASMTTVAASGPIQYEQDGQDSVAAPETGAYYRYADTYDEESLSSSEERFAHGHLASGLYDYNLHGSPATAATATAKVAAEVSVKGDKSDCYELGAQHGSAADASAVAVAAAAAATTARSGEGGNLGYNETPGQDVSAAGTAAAAAAGRAASGPIQYEQDGQDSVVALATGHTESASSTKIRILEHGHGSSRFSSSTASVTTSATESQKFSHGQGSVSDGTLASDDTARNANLYGNAGSFGFDEQFGSVKAKVAVAAAAGGSIEDRKSNHYGQHAADTSTAASPATAVATASGKGGQSYLYGTSGLHGSAASMTTVAASGPIQYEQDGQDSVAAPETGAYYRYADTYDEESLSSSEERFAHGHLASGLYDYNLHGSPATAATATAKVAAEVSVKGDKSDCYELGAQHGSAADASAVAVAAAAAATTARSGEGGNLGYNETPGQDVSAAGTAAAAAAGRAASGPIQYEQDGQDSVAALATGHTESASSTKIRILEHGHGSSRFSSSTASVTTSATESQKFSHGQGSVSDGTLASDDTARNANLYGNAGSFGFDEQFGSVKAKVAVAAAAGGSIEDRKSNHYGQHAADTSTAASPATAVATASGKGGQSYLYGTSGLHGSAASMTTVAASGPIQYEQDGQDSVAAPETGAYYRYADTYDEESLSSSEERFAHGHLASGLYDYNLHGSPATAATATAKVAAEVSVKGDKSDCYELGAQHGSAADASAVAVAAAAAATTARSGEGGNLGYNETPGQDVSAAGTAAAAAAGRAASGPIQYEQDGQDSVAALATGHTESASSTKIRILEHGHGSSRFSSSTASVTTSATESQKFSNGQGSVSDGTLASDDTARNANLYGNAGSFGFDEQFGSVKAKVAVAAAAGGSIEDRKSNHYGQHAADTSTAASPATAVATAFGKSGQSYLYGTSGLHGSAESMTTVAASGPIQYEQDGQDSVAAPETGAYYRYADTYDEESLSSSEERFAHGHLASGLYDYNLHGSPATAATATAKVAAEVSVKGDKSDCYELGAQHGSAADASAVAVAAAAAATTARSGEGGNLGYNETPGQDVSAAGTAAAAAAGRAASGPIQYEHDSQDSVRFLEHGHGSSRSSSSTTSVTTSKTVSRFSAAAAKSRGSGKQENSEYYGPSGHRSANQVKSSAGAATAAGGSSSLSIPARTATSVATESASTSAGGLDENFIIEEGYGLLTSPSTVKQEFHAPYGLQSGSGSSTAAGAGGNAGVSASGARGRKNCRITRRQLFVKYGTHRSPCTTC